MAYILHEIYKSLTCLLSLALFTSQANVLSPPILEPMKPVHMSNQISLSTNFEMNFVKTSDSPHTNATQVLGVVLLSLYLSAQTPATSFSLRPNTIHSFSSVARSYKTPLVCGIVKPL